MKTRRCKAPTAKAAGYTVGVQSASGPLAAVMLAAAASAALLCAGTAQAQQSQAKPQQQATRPAHSSFLFDPIVPHAPARAPAAAPAPAPTPTPTPAPAPAPAPGPTPALAPAPAHTSAGAATAAAAPARGAAALRELLLRSVPWDPQVRVAAAAQTVAQERLRQSRSRLWPTLGLSATAGDGNDEEFGRKVGRRIDRSELLLRWNLYNGGADAAEVTATEREWAAATEDLNQTLDLVAERIGNAYLDAWRWQSLMEPSLARLNTIERWVEQARTQLRAGRLSDADLQQAEYSLTDAQMAHQVLVSELAAAMGSLNVLVGEPVAALLPQTLPRISPEEAKNLKPAGVRVARLRAEAASSRVVSAAQMAAPRVDLDARKRLSDNTKPAQTTTPLENWSVGMRWEMPLGGETFARRREMMARAEGAQAEVARVEQGLVSELASIAPKLASGEQALVQLQTQAEQYNAMLRAGRMQFEAGRRTLQQLIQLEDARMGVVQRLAEQNNRLDQLRLRLLVLSGRLSSAMGIDPAPAGSRRGTP